MQALVTHVFGARPNFMKAAPVIRALAGPGVQQMLIHTVQHYNARMSDVFFADLGLPESDVNLHVGSGELSDSAGVQSDSAGAQERRRRSCECRA